MKHRRHHRVFLGWFILMLLLGVVWGATQFTKQFGASSGGNQVTAATTSSSVTTDTSNSSASTSTTEAVTSPTDASSYANLTNGQTIVKDNEGQTYDEMIQKSGFYGSALVVHNGQIVLSKGYGYANVANQVANNPNSLYNIGSLQKGFTGTLIMKAAEEGKLSLGDKLSKYFPQIAGADQVTLQQMLDMASGLQFTNAPTGLTKDSDVMQYIVANAALKNTVGKFDYQAINFNLLSGILEQVYKETYYTLFDNYYGKKAGITGYTFYQNLASNANVTTPYSNSEGASPYGSIATEGLNDYIKELGTGNVFMSTGQLYRYYSMLLSGQLITKADEATLQTPIADTGSNYASGLYNEKKYFYGHGAELTYETFVALSPDGQTAVILLSNQMQEKTKIDKTLLSDLFETLTGNATSEGN